MAGFWGQQVNNAAGAFFGSDYLRDYTHASKIFRTNGYQYSPKFKFLFHVYFDINQAAYPIGLDSTGANFGLAVKTVKLPSYNFATHEMNQYNRKRIVQTKIKYDPIDITFHDDNGNIIRNMWYNYYLYYYNDSNKPYIQSAGNQLTALQTQSGLPGTAALNNGSISAGYNQRNLYSATIPGDNDWGYIGETSQTPSSVTEAALGQTKIPFFKNITVFGFNQHNYVAYTLINPLITSFAHDTYDYAQGNGTMENKMTLNYETVKYYQGAMAGQTPSNVVTGFGLDGSYDKMISPLAKPGSQNTILGQGGLVDAGTGFMQDLANGNILGAVQKAGTAYNTFKNVNITQTAKSEVLNGINNAITNTPNRNVLFQLPTFGSTPSSIGTAGAANGTLSAPPVIISTPTPTRR